MAVERALVDVEKGDYNLQIEAVEVEVVMLSQPWLQPPAQLTSVKVIGGGPQIPGALTTGDPTSSDSLALADTAVGLLNKGSFPQVGTPPYTLVGLAGISTQVRCLTLALGV